jgi:hypothetical protein
MCRMENNLLKAGPQHDGDDVVRRERRQDKSPSPRTAFTLIHYGERR